MATFGPAGCVQDGFERVNATVWETFPNGGYIGYYGDLLNMGFLFQSVAVPQGATITSATLTVNVTTQGNTPVGARLYCEDVDDAPALTGAGRRVSQWSLTTAYEQCPSNPSADETFGATGPVQEIVSRTGWASGNDMAIGLVGSNLGNANWAIIEMINNPGTAHATLTIVYTAGAAGETLDAEGGAVTSTGQAADLLQHRVLDAEGGAVSLAGQAADLERGLVIAADGGAVSVAGQDATLTEAGEIAIAAESGAVTVSGTAAGLLRSLVLSAEGGSVSVAGQAAFFALDRVGEAGAVAIAGQDVALSIGRTLDAEGGSVTLAGTDATLLVDYVLDAEGAAVSVDGQEATLTAAGAFAIGAEEGAVAVAGQNVDLLRHYVLSAEAGSVGLSGTAVATPRDYLLAAALGAVQLTGADATLQIGDELLPAPADIFGRTGRVNIMGRT